ncbi:MAG: hypothetical protein ACOZNI_33565, partial [Myxococcota bacterium]
PRGLQLGRWLLRGWLLTLRQRLRHRVRRTLRRARAGGYARALGAGVGAGVLGAVAWGAVRVGLQIELGILAIGVGWIVASAMRWGAGKGGLLLQIAAVVITYVSIVEATVLSELAVSDADAFSWIFGFVAAVGLVPYAQVAGGGVGAILWVVIVGIALHAAWRRLDHPKLPWVGPLS